MNDKTPPVSEIRLYDRFPLIVIEFSGAADDTQFAEYLRKLEDLIERRAARPTRGVSRTAVLIDTTAATRPVTANQRRMQAEYIARMQAKAKPEVEPSNAVCFVISSMVIRGVLTAIMWLRPMPDRAKVCATREEADLWCRRWIVGAASHSEPPKAMGAD